MSEGLSHLDARRELLPQSNEFEDSSADLTPLVGRLTPMGWEAPRAMSFEQWAQEGRRLRACHHGVLWGIGDWLNAGEIRYGETYAQAVEETGYSDQFLRVCKYVAARFPPAERHPETTFSHHRVVASLDAESAKSFLTVAGEYGWSAGQLADAVADVTKPGDARRSDKPLRLPKSIEGPAFLKHFKALRNYMDRRSIREIAALYPGREIEMAAKLITLQEALNDVAEELDRQK